MLNLFKVAFPQSKKRGPIHLCISADPIGGLWMEWLALAVLPDFVGMIPVFQKNCVGIPIFFFPGQESAPLKNQDPLPARGKALGECTATSTCSNDDYVVVIHETFLQLVVYRMF